jgi:aspartate aminotransferase
MLSEKVVSNLTRSSLIRAMFEEGEKLRKIHGADKVYDFSLGNPNIEPPKEVKDALKKVVTEDQPKLHSYMPNAGYPDVRACVAENIKSKTGISIEGQHIVMTVGASGALNVVLKAILNPDEEVIVFAPYFVDYLFYIDNNGGKGVVIPPNLPSFEPDPETLYNAITPKTKAVIINTPNNPTGVVYSEETLKKIAEKLEMRQKEFGTTIFLLSDEPYKEIVYGDVKATEVMNVYKNTIIVYSFSKSLSLPGERIGYIAVNPAIENVSQLVNALIFSIRVLGFVNAPGLFQRILPDSINAKVEVGEYQKRRDLLYDNLTKFGYKCQKPEGAFYLFVESLIPDDAEFCKKAMQYNLVFTPGRGFNCPGYFRIAYCVDLKMIENSLPAFEALAKEYLK